jgi:hypothetical protein
MPIHDWTKVRAGTFHNFHFLWTATLSNRLNAGLLPPGFFAMAEQVVDGPEPDVVTLHTRPQPKSDNGDVAVALPPPRATFVLPAAQESERYARKARRIAIHAHELGNVVAVIEIVSPGNKASKNALRAFVRKTADLIWQGVNPLVVDLFPPGRRDPQGIHPAIWDEITEQPFELPPGKPLTLASYQAAPAPIAYVEPVAVGQALPDMALFLHEEHYIYAPLEETYQTTWNVLPIELRQLLEPPA